MNARMTIAGLAMFGMLASAAAAAPAVGTAKARGDYRSFWETSGWSGGSARRSSGRSYSYQAPAYSAPAPVASAPMVASAPTEERRFSYNPAAPAAPAVTSGSPCAGATTTAPAAGGDRRFSYDPSATTTVTPAPAVEPRVYSTRPSYSSRDRSSSNLQPWQRLKTDPLKYTN